MSENEKRLNGRIVNKHDIEANWLKATNFTPMLGELIVYDVDEVYPYERFKIGDGITNVNDLPFSQVQSDWNTNDETDLSYVKNRPFYELNEVTWDGNIEGLVLVEDSPWYKVSSLTPSKEDLIGFSLGVKTNDNSGKLTISTDTMPYVYEENVGLLGIRIASQFVGAWIAMEDNATTSDGAYIFPEKGIYFAKISDTEFMDSLSFATQTKRIDPKFLPENIQSDWSENDETSISYVKNRTHYAIDREMRLVVPESTVSIAEAPATIITNEYDMVLADPYAEELLTYLLDNNLDADENVRFVTTFDGVEYETPYWIDQYTAGMIGNPALFITDYGDIFVDNGAPFMIVFLDFVTAVLFTKDTLDHTFSVNYVTLKGELKQLDEKYIPTFTVEDIDAICTSYVSAEELLF